MPQITIYQTFDILFYACDLQYPREGLEIFEYQVKGAVSREITFYTEYKHF